MKLSRSQGSCCQEVEVWELMQPRKIRRLAYKSSSSFDCFDLRCLSFFHHRPSFFFLRRWWFDFSLSPFVVRVIRIHWPSLSLVVSLPLLSDFFPWYACLLSLS